MTTLTALIAAVSLSTTPVAALAARADRVSDRSAEHSLEGRTSLSAEKLAEAAKRLSDGKRDPATLAYGGGSFTGSASAYRSR